MRYLFALITLLVMSHILPAQTPTRLVVRAKAKDAKFIGTSIGGAYITVQDAQTGEVLARGYTSGSTGNTSLIMEECHERGQQLSDENTAAFTATLDLVSPRRLTIKAVAPAAHPQAAVEAQTQVWLLPGKHIEGDGIVLEIPGFIVDVLAPQTHEVLTTGKDIEIRANVVMMCGCPLSEGGMWNASAYEVKALVMKGEKVVGEVPLTITEKVNTFAGTWQAEEGGSYQLMVYAYDPVSGNTGLDKATVIVR